MEFYEFFAGGGMARSGLGANWRCSFANEIDVKKAISYRKNFPGNELLVDDICHVTTTNLPGKVDLAWASFPCQDLSLAGVGVGLDGRRSGVFWPFWRLMQKLKEEGRAPRTIILENVYGAITSHHGHDLATICEAISAEGYAFAPMVIDAALFLPQSRPRLFIIAFAPDASPPNHLLSMCQVSPWHPDSFGLAYDQLSDTARSLWLWMGPAYPPPRTTKLADIIEHTPTDVKWHTPDETQKLLAMMSPINLDKIKTTQRYEHQVVGTVYKRTRIDEKGVKKQRAEVRFDGVAGCLRTPAGGSSRQIIIIVNGNSVRTRLLSPREAARLMGLPDHYQLPEKYNEAYHLAGDGVAAPVVSWLAKQIIEPAVSVNGKREVA
jgi:DNA (cytosine-5)-methyltransferase 1